MNEVAPYFNDLRAGTQPTNKSTFVSQDAQ